MAAEGVIRVEVCYALPEVQAMVGLTLPAGSTARQALLESGLVRRFPEIDPAAAELGIAGRRVAPEHSLADGDRVEVLRPLIADPKEARRKRAEKSPLPRRKP